MVRTRFWVYVSILFGITLTCMLSSSSILAITSVNQLGHTLQTISTYFTNVLNDPGSLWLRLLVAFALGILMSLTPCIYPMIPITVGILQSRSSQSWTHHLFHAISYTLGLAATFAVLGLLVASGTAYHGALFNNPWFILAIVAFLAYMAFSLFDFYPLYIPQFLSSSSFQQSQKRGTLFASFLFGAATGTMASPCLSPGLALLLTVVAQTANKFQGFLLLFLFGLGTSVPLLLISSFSHAFTFLPRAGSWMSEIKKFFGLMILGTCLYYLTFILPTTTVLKLAAAVFFTLSVHYKRSLAKESNQPVRGLKFLMSTLLLLSGVFCIMVVIKSRTNKIHFSHPLWSSDYLQAYKQAKAEQKPLLIDFTADWCTLCKAVEKSLLNQLSLRNIVYVKVDYSQSNAITQNILKEFSVQGFPTLILLDVTNNKVLKRWTSEVAHVTPSEFQKDIESTLEEAKI